MDRHDFVEKLLAEKAELEAKRSSLFRDKDLAHRRSYGRFKDIFNPPKKDDTLYFANANFDGRIGVGHPIPAEHKVSTEEIKELCAEVKALEKENAKLEEEIEQLKKQDFIAEILKLADLK